MKIYRYRLPALLLAMLMSATSWGGGGADYAEHLAKVNDQVEIAGLLDLEVLRASREGEILVVDLRTEAEGTAVEASQAESLGLGYVNIPVSSVSVDRGQLEALRNTLSQADPDALVVVHCASGNRAGVLWGAVQLEDGQSLESVKAALDGVLTKQPAIDGLEAFAQTLDAGR